MQAVCLLALACGMLAGCKKDGGVKASVQFSATSNSAATRTAYSGEGETTSGKLTMNTRPPDLPLEKPICRSGSNS